MSIPGEKLPYLQLDPPLAIPRRTIECKKIHYFHQLDSTVLPSILLKTSTAVDGNVTQTEREILSA